MTAIALPSRRERRQNSRNYTAVFRHLPGLLLAAFFTWLIWEVWYSDIYHFDRRFIPVITIAISGTYAVLGLWLAGIAIKKTVPYYRELLAAKHETAAVIETTVFTRVMPTMVIDKPRLKKHLARGFEFLISASVWAVFLYLSQSLATAVLWVAGGRYAGEWIFSAAAIEGTLTMLVYTLIYAAFIFIVLLSWASWNYWRYGRLERRKPRPPVQDAAVAAYYNVPLSTVYSARMAKLAYLMPNEDGVSITVKDKLPVRREDVMERRAG